MISLGLSEFPLATGLTVDCRGTTVGARGPRGGRRVLGWSASEHVESEPVVFFSIEYAQVAAANRLHPPIPFLPH